MKSDPAIINKFCEIIDDYRYVSDAWQLKNKFEQS
jgi:hypothetical protein